MSKIDIQMYNHIFHFNTYANSGKGLWAAIPRGREKDYFNNMSSRVIPGILFSTELPTLFTLLGYKNEG